MLTPTEARAAHERRIIEAVDREIDSALTKSPDGCEWSAAIDLPTWLDGSPKLDEILKDAASRYRAGGWSVTLRYEAPEEDSEQEDADWPWLDFKPAK